MNDLGDFHIKQDQPVQYIRDNVRTLNQQTSDLFRPLTTHLDYLLARCQNADVGDNRFMNGQGGLNIMGFLTFEEVKTLRSTLLGSGWSVSRDEPIDGESEMQFDT